MTYTCDVCVCYTRILPCDTDTKLLYSVTKIKIIFHDRFTWVSIFLPASLIPGQIVVINAAFVFLHAFSELAKTVVDTNGNEKVKIPASYQLVKIGTSCFFVYN